MARARAARHQGHGHPHSAQVPFNRGGVGDRPERVVIEEDQVIPLPGAGR